MRFTVARHRTRHVLIKTPLSFHDPKIAQHPCHEAPTCFGTGAAGSVGPLCSPDGRVARDLSDRDRLSPSPA